jgi:hypothetical protein
MEPVAPFVDTVLFEREEEAAKRAWRKLRARSFIIVLFIKYYRGDQNREH